MTNDLRNELAALYQKFDKKYHIHPLPKGLMPYVGKKYEEADFKVMIVDTHIDVDEETSQKYSDVEKFYNQTRPLNVDFSIENLCTSSNNSLDFFLHSFDNIIPKENVVYMPFILRPLKNVPLSGKFDFDIDSWSTQITNTDTIEGIKKLLSVHHICKPNLLIIISTSLQDVINKALTDVSQIKYLDRHVGTITQRHLQTTIKRVNDRALRSNIPYNLTGTKSPLNPFYNTGSEGPYIPFSEFLRITRPCDSVVDYFNAFNTYVITVSGVYLFKEIGSQYAILKEDFSQQMDTVSIQRIKDVQESPSKAVFDEHVAELFKSFIEKVDIEDNNDFDRLNLFSHHIDIIRNLIDTLIESSGQVSSGRKKRSTKQP